MARHLAARLGWEWVDADVEIERLAGKSIARIFAEDGEPAFRELEVQRRCGDVPAGQVCAGGGRRRAVARGKPPCDEAVRTCRLADGDAGDNTRPNDGRRHDGPTAAEPHRIALRWRRSCRSSVAGSRSTAEAAQQIVDTEGKSPEAVAEEILDVYPVHSD